MTRIEVQAETGYVTLPSHAGEFIAAGKIRMSMIIFS